VLATSFPNASICISIRISLSGNSLGGQVFRHRCHSQSPPQLRAPEQRHANWPDVALKLKEIWAIRIHLKLARRTRESALFKLAIDSKLRGCDPVAFRIRLAAQQVT
jgi:hypothetical protein